VSDYARQRQLLDEAFDTIADPRVPVAGIVGRCIRIAQIRRDYSNLWWLRMEAIGLMERRERDELDAEMLGHFGGERFGQLRLEIFADVMLRRRTGDHGDKTNPAALIELEEATAGSDALMLSAKPPTGLAPLDLYFANVSYQKVLAQLVPANYERRLILGRIRQRVHRFLTETEAALEFSVAASGAFERARAVVDRHLSDVAPEALAQFRAAYERAAQGDEEARSHALTSCRRVLKSVADRLYPPTGRVVRDQTGREHKLTDDKYLNRLVQYATEAIQHQASRKLTIANVDDLSARLDALDDLASKGVHEVVSTSEMDQCILQTYLVVGDLLLLGESAGSSAPAG